MAGELAKLDEASLCLNTGIREYYSRYTVTTGEISREEISRCQTLAAQMSNLLEIFDNIIELANKRAIDITAKDGRHLIKILKNVVPAGLALKPQALRMQHIKSGESTYKLIRTVNHSAQVLLERYRTVRNGREVGECKHEFADELPKLRQLAETTGASSEDEEA
jgi:hypothetical protein